MSFIGQIDLNTILSNRSPILIICSVLIIFCYSLNFLLSDCENIIGLVPANTLITNKYVWNVISSCFYENNIWKVLSDLISIYLLTSTLNIENIEQFGLYFVFSILASTIGASAYCFIRFFATGHEEYLTDSIFGFNGIIMSVLMFARQQKRNALLYESIPGITYHNSPILFILYEIIFLIIGVNSFVSDFYFLIISMLFCWSYLRFFYKFNENDTLGDKSEEFSFVNMFPEVIIII